MIVRIRRNDVVRSALLVLFRTHVTACTARRCLFNDRIKRIFTHFKDGKPTIGLVCVLSERGHVEQRDFLAEIPRAMIRTKLVLT